MSDRLKKQPRRTSRIYQDNKYPQQSPRICLFCTKLQQQKTITIHNMLNLALYQKYSSSQNYFFSKDINDIIENQTTQLVIRFTDQQTMDEDEEFLKKFYSSQQLPLKKQSLIEYYKFHINIPRLFMVKICRNIYYFHDKKRRLEYGRIKRLLGLDDDERSNPSIHQQLQTSIMSELKNILASLSIQQKKKTQTNEASVSIQRILQSIPQMDPVQNNFYLESFEAINHVENQILNTQSLKPATLPRALFQSLVNNQKKKISQALQKKYAAYITPQVSKQQIQQQTLKVNAIKSTSPHMAQKNVFKKKCSPQQIDIETIKKLCQSDRQRVTKRATQPDKVSLKLQLRRTNSIYNPTLNYEWQKYNSMCALGLNQKEQKQSNPNITDLQKLLKLTENKIQKKNNTRKPSSGQNTTHSTEQKPKKLDLKQNKLLQNNEQITPNNIYLNGSGHKKSPSLYTINQNNIVNIFMDEQQKMTKSLVSKLTRSGNTSRNNSQRKISQGSLNKFKKL